MPNRLIRPDPSLTRPRGGLRGRSLLACAGMLAAGQGVACAQLSSVSTAAAGNAAQITRSAARVANKLRSPVRPEARLAALWVGHATVLLQLEDKMVLTDPVFTESVGQLVHRVVEPGIEPEALPLLDAVLISHVHFDHLSVGSIAMLEPKIGLLVAPPGGLVYVPDGPYAVMELPAWTRVEHDGMRITAVPVRHVGARYGIDDAWLPKAFTGYIVEYRGLTVYFGGDTAYDADLFRETRRRFPSIDLALLPIAPIHPREVMRSRHVDPEEAVQMFLDLGAKQMIPIHFDTFMTSLDVPGEATARLRQVMRRRELTDRDIVILAVGEQRVLQERTRVSGGARQN